MQRTFVYNFNITNKKLKCQTFKTQIKLKYCVFESNISKKKKDLIKTPI